MKTIFVRWQKEGIHKYTNAPPEVSFLRNDHRHVFHFEVEMEVFHSDREVEFIMLKKDLEKKFSGGNLNYKSCEMICDDVYNYLRSNYGNRNYKIEVSEDGENGARAYYTKDES